MGTTTNYGFFRASMRSDNFPADELNNKSYTTLGWSKSFYTHLRNWCTRNAYDIIITSS
jgi:hypothetical protein